MAVKTNAVAALAAAVAIGTVGLSPAANAAPPGAHRAPAAELAAGAVDQVAPWTAGGARDARSEQVRTEAAAERPVANGDQERYRKEKAAAVRGPAPTGAARSVPAGPIQIAATVPLTFNGLDQPTSGGFAVPDTIVAAGTDRVISATNSRIRMSTKAGGFVQELSLNGFFGTQLAGNIVDPKVFYDVLGPNDRFYVTGIQVTGQDDADPNNDVSRIWVAVSRTPNPASLSNANWCRYNLEGRRNVGTADVSFADRPEIGFGVDSFSFAANQFRFSDRGFTFAVIRVANKATLANNTASCPNLTSFPFQPSSTLNDSTRVNIGPAQHYTAPSSFAGTTNPAYFLSHNSGTGTAYHVFRVRNVVSGAPTLATVTLTSGSYGTPPDSAQPGSAVVIDTGGGRYDQVAGLANTVAGIFTTVCNFTAGTANESCTRTPRFQVGQSAAGAFTATLLDNTFAGYNDDIFAHHAGIAINLNGQIGSTWQFSGTGFFLGAEVRFKVGGGAWTGVSTIAGGTCALPESVAGSGSARSGDYTGAHTDPIGQLSMWQAGEAAVTIGGACQWRVRIARLDP